MGDKTDFFHKVTHQVDKDRDTAFAMFENRWMKKLGWVLFLSAGAVFAAVSTMAVSQWRIGTIDEALAGKVSVPEHRQKHVNVELRIEHVEQAVQGVEESVDRMEIYNAQRQVAQEKQLRIILKAINNPDTAHGAHTQ